MSCHIFLWKLQLRVFRSSLLLFDEELACNHRQVDDSRNEKGQELRAPHSKPGRQRSVLVSLFLQILKSNCSTQVSKQNIYRCCMKNCNILLPVRSYSWPSLCNMPIDAYLLKRKGFLYLEEMYLRTLRPSIQTISDPHIKRSYEYKWPTEFSDLRIQHLLYKRYKLSQTVSNLISKVQQGILSNAFDQLLAKSNENDMWINYQTYATHLKCSLNIIANVQQEFTVHK